jgi:hypothetical protein
MELLDINLKFNKRLESFAPCYSQSLLPANFKESHSTLVFKNPCKKICETRKLESSMKYHFVERKKRVEEQTKNSSEKDLTFCPESLTKMAVLEFHLWPSKLG